MDPSDAVVEMMPPHPLNVHHGLAPDVDGSRRVSPLCNNGVDPELRRVFGVIGTGTVTCGHCREILAGEIGPWTLRAARRRERPGRRDPHPFMFLFATGEDRRRAAAFLDSTASGLAAIVQDLGPHEYLRLAPRDEPGPGTAPPQSSS